ncbi:MAG: esterase-like activity of phytase family protein, partial [Pseudomonadota bacterium]
MTEDLRIATFNASLNRNSEGELIDNLSTRDDGQAQAVASIIQTVRPNIVLVNEFDFDERGEAADLFRDNYLEVSQDGRLPIEYPYVYLAPSNTGIASGLDLDNNGEVVTAPGDPGYGNDAFGFGNFPGQFGMVVYSQHPILEDHVRTFQNFIWQDMPGALLPNDPDTAEPADFYSPEELEAFRLSSKSHWDVPIEVDGEIIHVLAAHPTPPVFDGPEDRNGLRNHDEIRLFADYVTPGEGDYIYDDQGNFGGLGEGARFVILGDMNADPFDGDSVAASIQQLLGNPHVDVSISPTSEGGIEQSDLQGVANLDHIGNPALDTADFNPAGPGNLRVDYALPSNAGFELLDAGVFWPTEDDPDFELVGTFPFPSSDHRLTWVDVETTSAVGENDRTRVDGIDFLGEIVFETGFAFENTEVGGLSALAYDEVNDLYYALSDDRGGDTSQPRFYELTIDLGDGSLDEGDIAFTAVTSLTDGDGMPFASGVLDPEGLAFSSRDFLYLSSEGDASQLVPATVGAFNLEGEHFAQFDVPEKFNPAADGSSGIRNNLALESLTLTPNEAYLITATENALVQDGPEAALDDESPSRVLVFDAKTGEPIHEYIYETDTVANEPTPADAFATN